jgi:hypothetical protein
MFTGGLLNWFLIAVVVVLGMAFGRKLTGRIGL